MLQQEVPVTTPKKVVAWLALVAAVVTGVLVVVLHTDNDAPAAQNQPTAELKTITIGAASTVPSASVMYTCNDYTQIKGCGPEPVNGAWSRTIQVPAGTIVLVNVASGVPENQCWISDANTRQMYAEDQHNGNCSAVIT